MRCFILLFYTAITITAFAWLLKNEPTGASALTTKNKKTSLPAAHSTDLLRIQQHSSAIKKYAASRHYNTHYCFLVDMKQHSGSNRFFVYDLMKDAVVKQGLVAHGYGGSNGSDIHFSNLPGSNCTSVGKYKIGKSYYGRFGLAYKLYGLDASNSNAFNRYVVLHAHECVPDAAVFPQQICMSQGCPTVSPVLLASLKGYLDKAGQPVLLWIFQ